MKPLRTHSVLPHTPLMSTTTTTTSSYSSPYIFIPNIHTPYTRFSHTPTKNMENKNMSSNNRKSKKKPAADTNMCKKHPKHRQSPGVCSICLGEKLSKLPSAATSSSSRAAAITNASSSAISSSSSLSSLSSLSSQFSSNASSCSSPMHRSYRGSRNIGFEGKGFLLSFFKSGKNNNININGSGDHDQRKIVFTKSRSMAFVEEYEQGVIVDQHGIMIKKKKKKKKKGRFWSKLIRSTSNAKRTMGSEGPGLMHSRTMKDMLITRV